MRAGRLDRRISLLKATITADSFNAPVETWETVATVWAHAEPVRDGERLQSGQMIASRMTRFTIRYSTQVASVDPKHRLVFDGRTYDIHGVKEIGRREGLEITAETRAEAS